jgi:hypothetical protein
MAGGYVVQTAVGFSRLPAIMMVEAPAIAVPSSPPQVLMLFRRRHTEDGLGTATLK